MTRKEASGMALKKRVTAGWVASLWCPQRRNWVETDPMHFNAACRVIREHRERVYVMDVDNIVSRISRACDADEVSAILEDATAWRGYELEYSLTYREEALFADANGRKDMALILRAADLRCGKLAR